VEGCASGEHDLARGREAEVDLGLRGLGPAGRDDLGPGVEGEALGSVDVGLWPKSEFFQPPKEYEAMGTGIGTLTPIMPTLTSREKSRAALPSRVKIATPLP
jgi:hypothetical protein